MTWGRSMENWVMDERWHCKGDDRHRGKESALAHGWGNTPSGGTKLKEGKGCNTGPTTALRGVEATGAGGWGIHQRGKSWAVCKTRKTAAYLQFFN